MLKLRLINAFLELVYRDAVCLIPHLDAWIWAAATPAHYALTLTKTDKEKHLRMRVKQLVMVVRGSSSDSQYWPV